MPTPEDIETLGAYNMVNNPYGNLQFVPAIIDQSKDVLHKFFDKYRVPEPTREYLEKTNTRGQLRINDIDGVEPYGVWRDELNLVQYKRDELDADEIMAHEVAHKWWARLSEKQHKEFLDVLNNTAFGFGGAYDTFPLYNPIEAYADIYRYYGKDMPDFLKPFYAGLLPV